MRALLVEDNTEENNSVTTNAIELLLAEEQIICDTVALGETDLQLSKDSNHDIIILDLTSPEGDGFDLLLRLRSTKVKSPILILSGLSNVDQKNKVLGSKANDYVAKSFGRSNLVSRIQEVVRKSKGLSGSTIELDDVVTLNLENRTVDVKGKVVHLTSKEYAILELLATRKDIVLTKEMFLNHLYGGIDEPELKIIDVFVCKLRKKLADATDGTDYIETVWGRGYMLKNFDNKDRGGTIESNGPVEAVEASDPVAS